MKLLAMHNGQHLREDERNIVWHPWISLPLQQNLTQSLKSVTPLDNP